MRRRRLSRSAGRKMFRRSARRVHKRNLNRGRSLGGYRL